MRWSLAILILTIILGLFHSLGADDEDIFLDKLLIEGNRITKENVIRKHITLIEGKYYTIEALMDEINRTRENLQKTSLFSTIFFDDQIDENNSLILTLRLKEKNYFFFGPSGYIGYERERFYSQNALYFTYTNLFGNSSLLSLEPAFYENYGFAFYFRGRGNKKWYLFNTEFEKPVEDTNESSFKLSPGVSFTLSETFSLGANILLNRYNNTSSLGLFPFMEAGSRYRTSAKIKKWYYLTLSPYAGYNDSDTYYYGIDSGLNLYRDLLLKIVYVVKLQAKIQAGEVVDNMMYKTIVRGTSFDDYLGTKQFSLTNEIHAPLPWKPSISIVPFLDADLIGSDELHFLIGGGIGFHWFTRYQDPLIIEIAFGKGFMLNYQRRFQ